MTTTDKFEIAKQNHKKFTKANIDRLFGRGPDFDEFAEYGRRNGWYHIEGECFSVEQVTGETYDHTQGGWAHL